MSKVFMSVSMARNLIFLHVKFLDVYDFEKLRIPENLLPVDLSGSRLFTWGHLMRTREICRSNWAYFGVQSVLDLDGNGQLFVIILESLLNKLV